MAAHPLGYWDYVKAAFGRKLRLPLLGAMPANKMMLGVFAVLGLASPGFWFLGAAAELTYLFTLANSSRFQKLVDGERLLAAQQQWEDKVHATVGRLIPPAQERYRKLLDQCRRILGISARLESDSLAGLRGMRGQSLNQLLWIFLRLLTSRQVITNNMESLDESALGREIEQLEQRLSGIDRATDEALARSLEGTLAIRRKRIENLQRASDSLRVIDAELERIEQQAELMREETAVGGKPEFLSARLDAVTSTMTEAARWMDEQADLFGALGADNSGSETTDLPSMPPMLEESQ
jgi:hypothetical protein